MNGLREFFLAVLILGLVQACATYRPMPLDHTAFPDELAPSSMEAIRMEAKRIQHPILKPLDLDIRNGLSPDEAAVLAVFTNPKLRAVRDERGVAAAQLVQAGILPNPQLSYLLDIPTGRPQPGLVNAFGADLSWEITSLITHHANVAAAKAEAVSVDLDVAWQEWQTAEAAKLQVYHLYFFDQQLGVAREEEKALRENLALVKRAADKGFVTKVGLAAAEAALQQIHASVLTTEQQREEERLALNQSLGVAATVPVPLEGKIGPFFPESLPPRARFVQGIEDRRLDLLALRKGYQSEEERLRAAVLAQFPKISLGFSHAGDTSNVITTGFGVTIDLPLFDRNQGNIAIEKATRAKLYDEYAARLFEARGEVARILADAKSLQSQIANSEESVATLKNLVDSYHIALLQGNADVLTYYSSRGDLIAKRMELVNLKRQLADMRVALEIASARYLAP